MTRNRRPFARGIVTTLLTAILSPYVAGLGSIQSALAAAMPTCQASPAEISRQENLRQAALSGSQQDQQSYQAFISEQAQRLQQCRSQNWPQIQAIWLRLYPCDANPGVLDSVFDEIVNKGYNQVYVEVFYDGQVLLPAADNPTPWPSVLRHPGYEKVDLLAQAIAKGKQRGLKVYAWLFTMNFGYAYAQLPDRQEVLARNGNGQTTLTVMQDTGLHDQVGESHANHAFIDPYSPQARRDYSWLLGAILQRRPDGMLFDYVRYLRGVGPASVVSKVEDLWIHSQASVQTLYQRALNRKGQELIRRFVANGQITAQDIADADKLYPDEGEPLWQGRTPPAVKTAATAAERQPVLQWELWYLSVAHAVQGILDFVALAVEPVQRQGIPAGVVFFPGGNRPVGEWGYDSRLQPWDRFPSSMEWHPMAYANCGKTYCIMEEIERVVRMASEDTKVIPALAGNWGEEMNRPTLEAQMQDLQRRFGTRINAVSHFAYSWQEPESDRSRKFCKLQ